ncbi:efflux transporter outer membrane subunit [bacterium]|nr:efflux transporter outer membrane subunit [bacterium]
MIRSLDNAFVICKKKPSAAPMAFFGHIALLLLVTGCAMGPNYQRPAELVPEDFRTASALTRAETTSLTLSADMPWWEVFKDPRLQSLIQTALVNNQDLKIATSRIDEARALLGITSSELYPALGATGSVTRSRTPASQRALIVPPTPANPDGVYSPRYNTAYAALLDLSWEVDLWGRVRRSRESARAELLATAEARDTIVSFLVTEVARSYFALLELDREVEITSATLQSRERILYLRERRREQGLASDLEVRRFQAEVSGVRASLAVLEQQVFQTENALSALLGEPPQSIRRGLPFQEQPRIPTVPVGLPADLLERRPDLRAAEQQLVAATARIGAAKAAFFPRIALTASYGYRSTELKRLIESNSPGWLITGAAAQPLFEGGRNWFNYKATQARREQAVQNYRKTILQALREVSDALIARKQTALEREQRAEQVAALQDSVRLSERRYDAGQSSYLELLDAQQQLLAAELLWERARLNELLASVLLYKALGGGVQTSTPSAEPL